MGDYVIYPSEACFGDTPREYPLFCRSTPASQSFYISTSFSLLTQLCRLKATGICKDIIEKSTHLISDGLKLLDPQNPFATYANYFPKFLSESLNKSITELESFLLSYGAYLTCGMRVLLAGAFSRSGNTDPCSAILNIQSTHIDEEAYLQMLSSALPIAIEYFQGVNKVVYCEPPNMAPKLLISIGLLTRTPVSEYAALKHQNFEAYSRSNDRNLLGTHPFVYSPAVQRVPSYPMQIVPREVSAGKDIPKAQAGYGMPQNPKMVDTLNLLFQILVKREWKFSEEETGDLKPKIKELARKGGYEENARKVLNVMKRCTCEHGFQCFVKLQCQKMHCFACIQEEIALKSLGSHQIFCACKQRLTDNEIQYYFSITPNQPQMSRLPDPQADARANSHAMVIEKAPELNTGDQRGFNFYQPDNEMKEPVYETEVVPEVRQYGGMQGESPRVMPGGIQEGKQGLMPMPVPGGNHGPMPSPGGIPVVLPVPIGKHGPIPGPMPVPGGVSTGVMPTPGGMPMPTPGGMPMPIPGGVPMPMPLPVPVPVLLPGTGPDRNPSAAPGPAFTGFPMPSMPGGPGINLPMPLPMPTGPIGGRPPAESQFSTGTLPKMNFCSKCRLPIKQSDLTKVNNMLYHKDCA